MAARAPGRSSKMTSRTNVSRFSTQARSVSRITRKCVRRAEAVQAREWLKSGVLRQIRFHLPQFQFQRNQREMDVANERDQRGDQRAHRAYENQADDQALLPSE